MHTDIVCIKADDIYKEIAENVETIFDIPWIRNTITERKKWKSNWINERWIRWKNYGKTVRLRRKT